MQNPHAQRTPLGTQSILCTFHTRLGDDDKNISFRIVWGQTSVHVKHRL